MKTRWQTYGVGRVLDNGRESNLSDRSLIVWPFERELGRRLNGGEDWPHNHVPAFVVVKLPDSAGYDVHGRIYQVRHCAEVNRLLYGNDQEFNQGVANRMILHWGHEDLLLAPLDGFHFNDSETFKVPGSHFLGERSRAMWEIIAVSPRFGGAASEIFLSLFRGDRSQ